jgi:hypothetical protein
VLHKRETALVVLCAAVLFVLQLRSAWAAHTLFGDYRAFWCAANVLVHGGNPYQSVPLVLCERTAMPWHLYSALPNTAVPAPLPPYAIAAFVPLAAIPYAASCIVFMAILLTCTAACAVLASRLFAVPAIVPACAFALPAVYLWLPYGEIVPIALAAALFSIAMLRAGRPTLSAAALGVTAIEPHVALGAWIAVWIYRRRMRLPLTVAAGVLAALWIAASSQHVTQYVLRVLPVHALAELPRTSQLGWTWILHELGAPDRTALQAAAAIAVSGIALSVCIAGLLYRRREDDAVLIALPLAGAAVTATFLHAAQAAFLLPWAFAFWSAGDRKLRVLSLTAILLAAVPWLRLLSDPLLTLPVAAAAAACASAALQDRINALRCAVLTAALCAAVLFAHAHDRVVGPPLRSFPKNVDSTLASASWGRYVWAHESRATIAVWAAKAPLWSAMLLLIGGTLLIIRTNEEIVPRIGIEQAPVRP